jgi:hypothetical protein
MSLFVRNISPIAVFGKKAAHARRCCWDGVFSLLFNVRMNKIWIPKPASFPLNRQYLCTDREAMLAFIFCTCKKWGIRAIAVRPLNFDFGGTTIKLRRCPITQEVIAHVTGSLEYNLTKAEVQCLIDGYPPFYREMINCGRHIIPSPIRDDRDMYRGGWIISVGLSGDSEFSFRNSNPTSVTSTTSNILTSKLGSRDDEEAYFGDPSLEFLKSSTTILKRLSRQVVPFKQQSML